MKITFDGSAFLGSCRFDERKIFERHGFEFDSGLKRWLTYSPKVAARLREHCDLPAREAIDRTALKISRWLGPVPYPKGLKPYGFQVAPSALFSLSRNRSLLALDPGLGKTPIAAMVANALGAPTVIICPPFLARNVEAELARWSTTGLHVLRLEPRLLREPSDLSMQAGRAGVLIVPDTLLCRDEIRTAISGQAAWARFLGRPALLIVDEAHRYKNDAAKRTRALFKLSQNFPRQVYLTGTPMPNGPIELYPILSHCAPELIDYMTKIEYGMRYCSGHLKEAECPKCRGRAGRACNYCKGKGGFENGFDFSGASNLAELKRKISPFMLRLRKEDVRDDLPAKTEEIVVLGELPPRLMKLDAALVAKHSLQDLMAGKVPTDNTAVYRRELGLFKLKTALDFLRGLLEEGQEAILVFAYHREVVARLAKGLEKYRPFVVVGYTPGEDRHDYVRRFQKGESRLFIGNYKACGEGLTLTRATRVVFVEQSWVYEENRQAYDRTAQRIGQMNDVHIQYLLYENSLDMQVMRANLRKRNITSQI